MAIDLMDGGNTEEDEAVAHIVKANPKQHAQLEHASAIPGKAKQQRDRGKHQQSDRETRLHIILCLPADKLFQSHLFNFNLAAMTSLSLILTCWTISMSTVVLKMRMTGSTISTS